MAARRRRKTTDALPESDYELSGNPMRLISWQVESVLGIKAAFVDADGKHVLMIGGDNGAGKTSLCKALEMAICGKSSHPVDAIHHGASHGTVEVKLSELTVHLTLTHGGSTLRISDATGRPIRKSPQALLNQLFHELSFDPLHFAYMQPSEQDAELKRLGGIAEQYEALTQEHDRVFAERTEVNRDVKRLTAQVEGAPYHEDAPEKERSSGEVLAEIDALREAAEANQRLRQAVAAAAESVAQSVEDICQQESTIVDLEMQLKTARLALDRMRKEHEELLAEETRVSEEAEKLADPDVAKKRAELDRLEEDNRKVRENAARAKLQKHLDEVAQDSREKTARLEAIEDEQLDLMANASFPVDGLGFSNEGSYIGPTLNGVPLPNVNRAALIRLSCAIGFAQNPKLKLLLVKDAAALDRNGLKLMEELAEEHDGLVILERVGDQDEAAIIIEDGAVRDTPQAAE
jgi:recombinational DNA repair ATPase RecF